MTPLRPLSASPLARDRENFAAERLVAARMAFGFTLVVVPDLSRIRRSRRAAEKKLRRAGVKWALMKDAYAEGVTPPFTPVTTKIGGGNNLQESSRHRITARVCL